MSAPFDNAYTLRRVADADARPCAVCYKPSTSVLVTADSKDFFYVCAAHLKDDHFASAIPSDTYTNLLAEKAKLDAEVKAVSVKADQQKPGVFQYIPGFSAKEKDDDKESYKTLSAQKKQLVDELEALESQIAQFVFKQFRLHPDMFRVRWRNYVNKKMGEKRAKDMASPGFFPSVPTGAAGGGASAGAGAGDNTGDNTDESPGQ